MDGERDGEPEEGAPAARGQQVGVEIPAMTPLELSAALSKTILSMPGLGLAQTAKSAIRRLSPRGLARRLLGRERRDEASP